MWLSPSSSSCVPRRRVGRAEPDRSQCGAWWVIPGGRRLFSVLHTGATRTPAEPPHGHPTHFTRPPTPKTTPPETTTPHTRTRPRCPHTPQPQHKTEPISSRNRTDLKPEPDRSRAGTGPISTRSTTDLDAELDRSRRGLRPISSRNRTDLDTGCDRSRHGLRPISARLGARGWVWQGSCVNLVGGQSGASQAPAPAILRAGREMSVCRAAVRQASTITSMTAGRGRSLRVTISTRRCSWASGRTSTAG